jgi:NTE family protein
LQQAGARHRYIVVDSERGDGPPFVERRTRQASGLTLSGLLQRALEPQVFEPGDVLVSRGDDLERLFLITAGTVCVQLGEADEPHVVARLGRGAWIGETALLTGAPSSTTVVAETRVTVLGISQRDFLTAAEADPAIFREVARELAQRLRSADEIIDQARPLRLVGVHHDDAELDVVERVIEACVSWARIPVLTLAFGMHRADTGVREFLADPLHASRLRARIAAGLPVTVAGGDATDEDIDTFLRLASAMVGLVVVRGARIPQQLHARLASLAVVHRPGDAAPPPAGDHVRAHTVAIDARFDAGRVARTLCGRRVGLALGGGGTRGFAHIGALATLAAAGMPVDAISGTSIGSAIGAGVAEGRSLASIGASIEAAGRGAMMPSLPPLHSTFSGASVERELERLFGGRSFEDLATPLAVVAVDLASGEEITFTHGPLVPALQASMAVPGIFPPVRYAGRILVDGALRAPVPVRACRALGADVIIASSLRAGAPPARPRRAIPWMTEVIVSALDVMQAHIAAESAAGADVCIETVLPRGRSGLFDFAHRREIEAAGARAAEAELGRIVEAVMPAPRRAA